MIHIYSFADTTYFYTFPTDFFFTYSFFATSILLSESPTFAHLL
jgi:hypothetical protein